MMQAQSQQSDTQTLTMRSCEHCGSTLVRSSVVHTDGVVLGKRYTFFVPFCTCENCGHETQELPSVGHAATGPHTACAQCSSALGPGFIEHRIEPMGGKPQVLPVRVQICMECGWEEQQVITDDPVAMAIRNRQARANAIKKCCYALTSVARDAIITNDRASVAHLRVFAQALQLVLI